MVSFISHILLFVQKKLKKFFFDLIEHFMASSAVPKKYLNEWLKKYMIV
jgi:hypothetical protein